MRLVLIVNPGSGSGTDLTRLAARLASLGPSVDAYALDDLDAIDLGEADRIVLASGDGAIGPVAARAVAAGVPLAVVPRGTANDFARALEIPKATGAALTLAANPHAATGRFDVGCAGGHPFVNVASCGLSVVAGARSHALKRVLGPFAYPAGALSAGLTVGPQRVRVSVDGAEVFAGAAWQVLVAGSGAFGGGAGVDADLDDSELDVAIMLARGRERLAVHAARLLLGGLTDEHDVLHHRGSRIHVEGPRTWNVDGERSDGPDAGRMSVLGRVEVVVPRR